MIQLPEKIRNRLKSNWGDCMHAMECYAEVKLITPKARWGAYLLAMNPEDEDEIFVLWEQVNPLPPEIYSFRDLHYLYDEEGEYPIIDEEYRPRKALNIFKRLGGKYDR
jgi:hypothetical protein